LSGLYFNLFAFEEGGMRTLILSPAKRRDILIGKNIAVTIVGVLFSTFFLIVNHLIFRDLTWGTILFVALSAIIFAALMATMGNWLSIRFPKRMIFGKRSNVSGVVGLLLIPIMFLLAFPPLTATAAGYISESLVIEYATLAALAVIAVGFYLLVIDSQGELLQRKEIEVLEAVREPEDS
jgi:ABC-type Na+ efflux pump permease subunit